MLQRVFLCQRCFVASEEAAVAYVDEKVDGAGALMQVDRVGSVSGLELERDHFAFISDKMIDEQARRFHSCL